MKFGNLPSLCPANLLLSIYCIEMYICRNAKKIQYVKRNIRRNIIYNSLKLKTLLTIDRMNKLIMEYSHNDKLMKMKNCYI